MSTDMPPSNPTGQDFTSDAELPLPRRDGAVAAPAQKGAALPAENVPNTVLLTGDVATDGGDGGGAVDSSSGALGDADAQDKSDGSEPAGSGVGAEPAAQDQGADQ